MHQQATTPTVGKGESWAANKADNRSPGAASAAGTAPSVESQEEDLARGESTSKPALPGAAAAAALGAPGPGPAHQNVWDWRREALRCRAQGGSVKAIVSADYSGEIKVFIGFLGAGSEGGVPG